MSIRAKKIKIYIHYESCISGPAFTVCKILDNFEISPEELLGGFADSYKSKHGIMLDVAKLELATANNRKISLSTKLNEILRDKDDIFLVEMENQESLSKTMTSISSNNSSEHETTLKTSSTSSSELDRAIKSKSVLSNSPKPEESKNILNNQNEILELTGKLQELFVKKSYRTLRLACEEILQLPKVSTKLAGKYSKDFIAILMLARIALINKNFKRSVEYCRMGLAIDSNSADFHLILSQALKGIENYQEALTVLNNIIDILQRIPNKPFQSSKTLLDLLAERAECIFAMGLHNEAADSLNAYMSLTGAEEHVPTLLAYGYFASSYNKHSEALSALLKIIVTGQKLPRARKLLSQILSTQAGITELFSQIPPNKQSVAAYAFLATITKDFSQLESAAILLKKCVDISNRSASYTLNLIHIYITQDNLSQAYTSLLKYLRTNTTYSDDKGTFCSQLLLVLDSNSNLTSPRYQLLCHDHSGLAIITTAPIDLILPTDSSLQLASRNINDIIETPKVFYPEEMLEDMAIGFTAVKILFLQGRLAILPSLIELLEPYRSRSMKPLHETHIRNETAYYQCISQVLATRCMDSFPKQTVPSSPAEYESTATATTATSPSIALNTRLYLSDPLTTSEYSLAARNPIYVCGDSHTLSCSWSVVTVSGIPRLLVPKLVTGCKHWHLREEADFYPKKNFYHIIESIPEGSEVLFIMGEIDCREGLLVAVERDRYPTIRLGMEHTAGIFCDVLSSLCNKKKFRAYVHPILPILPETRSIVSSYNEVYQSQINVLSGRKSVTWLDFVDSVLTSSDTAAAATTVRRKYQLDGVHIHPIYVSELLEPALQRANIS